MTNFSVKLRLSKGRVIHKAQTCENGAPNSSEAGLQTVCNSVEFQKNVRRDFIRQKLHLGCLLIHLPEKSSIAAKGK